MSPVFKIVGAGVVLVLAYWLGTNTNDAVNEEQVLNIANASLKVCAAANAELKQKGWEAIVRIEELVKKWTEKMVWLRQRYKDVVETVTNESEKEYEDIPRVNWNQTELQP